MEVRVSTQDQAPATSEATADADQPQGASCRHCGAQKPDEIDASANPDWLCPSCDRYQDAAICPTCGGNARISLLPENMRPSAHEPARRRKAKE
jgi:rRNA maturation protein Nop10